MPRRKAQREEVYRVDDDDTDVEADSDPCERCLCPRSSHEDGKGECMCGCRRFKGA